MFFSPECVLAHSFEVLEGCELAWSYHKSAVTGLAFGTSTSSPLVSSGVEGWVYVWSAMSPGEGPIARYYFRDSGGLTCVGEEIHSFRVYFYVFSTRFECVCTSSPLVSSVYFHSFFRKQYLCWSDEWWCNVARAKMIVCPRYTLGLLHSFRVWFHIFSTRFECSFTSSPPVSSVLFQCPGKRSRRPHLSWKQQLNKISNY
jgi:hypothetical protein